MLRYYYTKEKDSLYVYDNETDYFMRFNEYTNNWEISLSSFMQVDHDNDDLTVISEESANKITNGASFEENYNKYLSLFNSFRNSENKK